MNLGLLEIWYPGAVLETILANDYGLGPWHEGWELAHGISIAMWHKGCKILLHMYECKIGKRKFGMNANHGFIE